MGGELRATWGWALAGALLLFGVSLAPDVLMMDSGEYQVAVHRFPRLGLGERPDDLVRVHPVYLAVARLISLIPIRSPAWRVNLVSAIFGAVAVANAALLAHALLRSRRAAVFAAMVLAAGHTLWAFASIAEVMTMLAAFTTAELLCWWRYVETRRRRWLVLLAVTNGLGVATHLQLGLNTVVHAVALLGLIRRRELPGGTAAALAVAWLVATGPYSAMIAYYGIHSGDWAAVLRSATCGRFGAPPTIARPETVLRGLAAVLLNYPTLLIVLAGPGLGVLRRVAERRLANIVYGIAGVQLLFALTYRVPDQYSFFIPFYAVAAVLIAAGAAPRMVRGPWRVVLPVLAVAPAGVYAVAPGLLRAAGVRFFTRELPYRDPYDFFIKPWKTGDAGQRRYVEEVFEALPARAVVFCSYTTQFMLVYAQEVDGMRPDVALVDQAAALADYLEADSDGKARWRRPVFATDAEARNYPAVLREQCEATREGLVWRVGPPRDPRAFLQDLQARRARE